MPRQSNLFGEVEQDAYAPLRDPFQLFVGDPALARAVIPLALVCTPSQTVL